MTISEAVKWLENLFKEIGKVENHHLWHFGEAISEINKLLKEQQPKLMTLAEVEKSKDKDVFVEVRYVPSENCDFPAYGAVFASTIDKEQPTYGHIWFYKHIEEKERYGEWWRCWTARPTEEQRKAEPWKDGEQEC